MRKKKVEEVGKSKVMRCSRYGNVVDCIETTGGPLKEVDCFKYLR